MEVSLREAAPGDREFLLAVYASTRSPELAALPWDDAAKAAFVRMQFDVREAGYAAQSPGSRPLVVSCDGVDAGTLRLAELPGEVRVVDVALLPAWRGRGVGARLLADVVRDAGERVVTLHVTPGNPAARLYERLGFVVTAADEATVRMERRPS